MIFKETYEPIGLNLVKDATRKKEEFPSIVHQELRPIGNTLDTVEYYLVKDLLNWLKARYSIKADLFPEWANKHFKNVDDKKLIINIEDKDKWIEIATLPKLIQISIKGFQYFNWKNINTNSPTEKYKIKAVEYLNNEAKNFSLEHMFEKEGKLSRKLTDQLARVINPENNEPK